VPALKQAKIDNFSWHDLRHTFASRLAMAAVDVRTIQELMGHATLTMTLRYAHLSPAHKLDAVRRLERGPLPSPTADDATGTDPSECSLVGAEGAPVTEPVLDGKKKWRRAESNCGPRDYETLALAI